MIPTFLDPDVRSAAEKRIFHLLRDDPATKDWIVLHSLGLSRHERNRYGEIDFVVLVPDGAIVCLEVKGGQVTCQSGVYKHTNRYGETTSTAKSPFVQARDGMFSLRTIIRDGAPDGTRLAHLACGFGVLFPDVEWQHSGPDYEAWQVYDRSFIGPISLFIQNIVAQNADVKAGHPRPASSDLKQLRAFLRPDFDYIIKPAQHLEGVERELLRLTEEQYAVLDSLRGNPRLLIEGPAGTGKTLLALEAARRAAARGERVLLLCFNRLLGLWLESHIAAMPGHERIAGGSFHRVLEREIIALGPDAAEFSKAKAQALREGTGGKFFTSDVPLYALNALAGGAVEPYDLLLIDEAQDLLREEFLTVFDYVLTGGLAGGKWIAFGDFNRQAIFAAGVSADTMRADLTRRGTYAAFSLNRNCRNTPRVGEATALMSGFESLPFELLRADDGHVDFRFYDTPRKERKVVVQVIQGLLKDGFKPEDIIILSPVRRENGCLNEPVEDFASVPAIVNLDDITLLHPPPDAVRFSTLQAFKGLECRAVVLIETDCLDHAEEKKQAARRSQLYVALSRPTSSLTVLLHEDVRPDHERFLKKRLSLQLGVGVAAP